MKKLNLTAKVMIVALLFGLGFWLIDGVVQKYFFAQNLRFMMFQKPETLLDAIILNISGHTLFVRISVLVACLAGGLLTATYMNRQKQTEVALQETNARLRALNRGALALAQPLTPEDAFAAVADELKKFGFSCIVFSTDEGQRQLSTIYIGYEAGALGAAEELAGISHQGFSSPVEGIDIFEQIVWRKKSIFIGAVKEFLQQILPGPARMFAGQIVETLHIHKSIGAPLIVGDEVIGALFVQADDLSEADVPAITAFAHQMAAAWRKVQLLQDLEGSLEALKRTQDQLLQVQKMEAIGRLAGGVAHDFNNILTVIQVSVQLLERKLYTEDPVWEYVQQIREASQRATRLTQQLLSFSRREIIRPCVLNLNQVIGDLSQMLRRIIGEDIQLVMMLADAPWPVRIDSSQIDQVIVNLAVNARDAMPGGGTLTIETANVVLDKAYAAAHVEAQPGEYTMLAINDTGTGMDDETKAHIFEPFFTTKEQGQGTGLGLATVFGIVKQNDGHIWVHSEVGQGTTFKIYLPRIDEGVSGREPPSRPLPLASSGRRPLPAATPTRGTETILLVEDEAPVRTLARRVLVSCGYQVLVAEDGLAALQIGERHDGPIHLLLTDVIMPHMGGRNLVDNLQAQRPEMRVLYMSGYTNNMIVEHGGLTPDVVFLSKPFSVEKLIDKVREVLDGRA